MNEAEPETEKAGDRLEAFGIYQAARRLFDEVWEDSEILGRDYRGKELVRQLVRSLDSICANIEEGYVVLVPTAKDAGPGVRLVWIKAATQRARPVPAGEYQVRAYALCRQDAKGVRWTVHASGEGRKLAVQRGQEARLDLDLKVTLDAKPFVMNGKPAIGGTLKGDHGLGLTLSQGATRITIGWKALAGGKEIESGTCAYG